MADLKVELVQLSVVSPHPDPETTALEIASIVGMEYRVVIRKGQFQAGDTAIYFPIDSVIPQMWIGAFGIEKYYHSGLRAARLRGVFSEGLLIDPCDVGGLIGNLGDDLTAFFGVTKAEPVLATHMDGECEGGIPGHLKFPEPEHWKKYGRLLIEGERVIITEKIHGTNSCLYKEEDGTVHFGSHNLYWKDTPSNASNVYIRAWKESGLSCPSNCQLFGEIYGLQDLKYGLSNGKLGLRLFAIRWGGEFLDHDNFKIAATALTGKSTVPVLYDGPYSPEVVTQFNNAESVVSPGQMMEGVVVQPAVDRYEMETGRLVLKYLSERYLLRKKGTESK